jgi:hypothetical protein
MSLSVSETWYINVKHNEERFQLLQYNGMGLMSNRKGAVGSLMPPLTCIDYLSNNGDVYAVDLLRS